MEKRKRRPVMQQPTTAVGAGVTLTSLVPLLVPPEYQTIGYSVAAALGVLAPILAARAGR